MQSQKISSKLYTARELSNLQRFYRARAFTLSIRAQNFNKNNRFLIENTYIIFGTIRTLSPNMRIIYRNQLITFENIKQVTINFELFPILISQSIRKFSQLSKRSSFIKGTSYQIRLTFPINDKSNSQLISIKQIISIIEQLKKFKFNEQDKFDFIPSIIIIPTILGCKTPRLFNKFINQTNILPETDLIQLQLFYIINVRFTIINIIKLNIILLNSIKG